MADLNRSTLRDLLIASYETFRVALVRRLGSDIHARDALHDVYVRLDRSGTITALRPHAYLFRMALNAATDKMRVDYRAINRTWVDDALLDLPDDGVDPVRTIAARQEVAILELALDELTPRRRKILLDARIHGCTLASIAADLDLSQRMVEIELKHALSHCAERLGRTVTRRFGPQPRKPS